MRGKLPTALSHVLSLPLVAAQSPLLRWCLSAGVLRCPYASLGTTAKTDTALVGGAKRPHTTSYGQRVATGHNVNGTRNDANSV